MNLSGGLRDCGKPPGYATTSIVQCRYFKQQSPFDYSDRAAEKAARKVLCQSTGFMVGKSSTSRMEALSVSSITSRSTPKPRPPVGGMPYSSAFTKS